MGLKTKERLAPPLMFAFRAAHEKRDAKKALEAGEKAGMDKARETLTQASHKLAEQMYKAAQAPPEAPPDGGEAAGPGAGSNGQAKKEEGVIDAEYVDVDDMK